MKYQNNYRISGELEDYRMKPIKLTEDSIKEYGQLLSANSKDYICDESDFRYKADVGTFYIEGNISTGILIGKKRELILEKFERHLKTPEVLVALENDAILALAKPCEKADDIKDITLLYMNQGDAICLHRGTWHWVPFPADTEECKMLVMFRENTGAEDGGVIELSSPVKLIG